jgi:hypothetical protein
MALAHIAAVFIMMCLCVVVALKMRNLSSDAIIEINYGAGSNEARTKAEISRTKANIMCAPLLGCDTF